MANTASPMGSKGIIAAHSAPRCAHVRLNGQPCGSPALQGNTLCYFHDRVQTSPGAPHFPALEDGVAIQCAIMQVVEGLNTGFMSLKTANSLLYALQTAASNLHNLRRDFDGAVTPALRKTARRRSAAAPAALGPQPPISEA